MQGWYELSNRRKISKQKSCIPETGSDQHGNKSFLDKGAEKFIYTVQLAKKLLVESSVYQDEQCPDWGKIEILICSPL